MHQQHRVALANGTQTDTPGAASADRFTRDPVEAHPGALAKLVRGLANKGINLQSVSGKGIEIGGVVWLAVADGEEERLRDVLRGLGYAFDVYLPEVADLEDKPGTLADFLDRVAASGRVIDTLVVGAPNRPHVHDHDVHGNDHEHVPGTIPVAARTLRVSDLPQ